MPASCRKIPSNEPARHARQLTTLRGRPAYLQFRRGSVAKLRDDERRPGPDRNAGLPEYGPLGNVRRMGRLRRDLRAELFTDLDCSPTSKES